MSLDPRSASDAELLGYAKRQVDRLVPSLPDHVDPAAVSVTAKIPFKIVVLREVLIHRAAELSDVACSLFDQGRVVSAFLITRGLLEIAALMSDLRDRVSSVSEAGGFSGLDDFLMRALLGSREADAKIQALNVLTVVNRVAKKSAFFRNSYDRLSEFAHPNLSGLLGSYAKHDGESLLVTLGREAANVPPRIGLTVLVGALEAFLYYYNDLGARLPDFIRQCEEALEGNAT